MKSLLLLWAVAACAYGYDPDEVQTVKSAGVKGGASRYIYKGGDNIDRFYGNHQENLTKHNDVEEIGVCYIEIPTAQLVSDQRHVPAGNGSRPELTRIRSCCRGYTRNIHDFMVCDPVCSNGCVNSLCVAPETCQCYPDYVKNSAGFCVATCPIGCQHGRCAGGECICDSGYKLDFESKYCMPVCKDNCGGLGNCTAPNTCSCQPGYQSTPEGSCRPGSGDASQYHVLPVQPIPSSNQVTDPSHPQNQNINKYPNPYNPNYPQGPYNQYPGNNPNSYPQRTIDRPHDNLHGQDSQMSRRPEDNFYPNQTQPYPYPINQYSNQGFSTQKPGQGPTQQPNQYPGYPYPSVTPLSRPNEANSSYPHRGDVDSDNNYPHQTPASGQTSPNNTSRPPGSIYPQLSNYNPNYQESNSYYAGGRQENSTWHSMNQHGSQNQTSGSYDASNQRTYDNAHQGTYNQSQQGSFDSRNQRTFGSNHHESLDTSNQRSYDSSRHNSYGSSHHGQYDSDYQRNYGNFNRDTQDLSAYGQYDQRSHGQSSQGSQSSTNQSNQSTQSTLNQGQYGSTQQGSYDSSRRDNQGSYDSSRRDNQGSYDSSRWDNQRSYDSSRRDNQESYDSSRRDNQESYDSSRRDNQGSYDSSRRDNQGSYDSSRRDNQGSYDSSRRETQGFSNQGTNDSTRHDTQGSSNQGSYNSNQGSYGTSQTPYPYYNSMDNPRQRPEVSNQVSNQTGPTDNSYHTSQQGYHHNFDLDQQTNDVPVCSMPCINGYCVEGNECRCKPGYIPDRTNPNLCLPHCPGGCPNGVCSGPRLCLCNTGYYKDTSIKGRQVCVKKIR